VRGDGDDPFKIDQVPFIEELLLEILPPEAFDEMESRLNWGSLAEALEQPQFSKLHRV
jgi:hypothetical protein